MFLIVGLVSAGGVLGYFYYEADKENKDLASELAEVKDAGEECAEVSGDCVHKLADSLLDFEFTYPSDWYGYTASNWSDDVIFPDGSTDFGPVISDYDVIFEKGDTELKFTVLLGPVDGFPSGLYDETHEYVEVSDEIVRWKLMDDDTWTYSSKSECTDGGEIFEDLTDADMCVGSFFPSFVDGGTWAVQAFVTDSDAEVLTEADDIALSVL